MGNHQSHQQLIEDKSYVTQFPRDIQRLIAGRLNNYDDIMNLHQLYPQLRDILYSSVREIFSEKEIVWNVEFLKKWTNLERTNLIVEVNSYDEMIMSASLPKLKTHRIILNYNTLSLSIRKAFGFSYVSKYDVLVFLIDNGYNFTGRIIHIQEGKTIIDFQKN